jgi:drug/metabolite transporter (DMT)-like permease
MSGALWALGSGFGFGLFQSLNRRALAGMDVATSTFLQLLVSAVVLGSVSVLTQDVGLIAEAPAGALVSFGLVGLIHFFLGWMLLNVGQVLIGAARTGPLLATTPLFGSLLAAIWLGESPTLMTVAGMTLTIVGVLVLHREREGEDPLAADVPAAADAASDAGGLDDRHRRAGAMTAALMTRPRLRRRAGTFAALGTALCWAISPIFIRDGLEGLPSPLLGVTVSMVSSALVFGVVLAVRRPMTGGGRAVTNAALGFKVVAGVLVGVATWFRWIALDRATVAVVLSVNAVSVPTVLLLAPVIVGRRHERVTARLWFGAGLVVAGSLVLIVKGSA